MWLMCCSHAAFPAISWQLRARRMKSGTDPKPCTLKTKTNRCILKIDAYSNFSLAACSLFELGRFFLFVVLFLFFIDNAVGNLDPLITEPVGYRADHRCDQINCQK